MEEVINPGKAYKRELPKKARASNEVDHLETSIGSKWTEVRRFAHDFDGQSHISTRRRDALIPLYSHLLRLDIQDVASESRSVVYIL